MIHFGSVGRQKSPACATPDIQLGTRRSGLQAAGAGGGRKRGAGGQHWWPSGQNWSAVTTQAAWLATAQGGPRTDSEGSLPEAAQRRRGGRCCDGLCGGGATAALPGCCLFADQLSGNSQHVSQLGIGLQPSSVHMRPRSDVPFRS